MRIGHGYDVHRLTENRNLVIGGVKIPFEMGLLGHSDADVLTHAVCDALLGAAALGDIGKHFPDSDDRFKGINSMILLEKTVEMVNGLGYTVENIDCTVIAQSPKMSPYIDDMRKNFADICKISIGDVNIKATTEEKLGFTGSMQGIAAHAVCLLK